MRVEFLPLARIEALEHSDYYRGIDPELDERFIEELDRIIRLLASFPAIGQRIGQNERRLDLSGFPYAVIYRKESDRLIVLAVSHHRRHPSHWQERTSK